MTNEPGHRQGFPLPYASWIVRLVVLLMALQLLLPSAAFADSEHFTSGGPPLTPTANSEQGNQSTNSEETLLLVVGIVASILTFILLIVLASIDFRRRLIEPRRVLEHIKVDGKTLLLLAIRGVNALFAAIIASWSSIIAKVNGKVPQQSQKARLPVNIEVMRQNSPRPSVMYARSCPKCGNAVRAGATYCSGCGHPLALPMTTPKSTIKLPSVTIEPANTPITGMSTGEELEKRLSEKVHTDLLIQIKLYLLWDRVGRQRDSI